MQNTQSWFFNYKKNIVIFRDLYFTAFKEGLSLKFVND